MITNNWTLTSSGPSDATTQIVAVTIVEGDYGVLYQPKSFIIKPTSDTIIKFISANSADSELFDNTNSTGIIMTKDNEYTFDPLECTVYKIIIAGLEGATSVKLSAMRYVRQYDVQLTKLSSGT
jgi:hypothetical protein